VHSSRSVGCLRGRDKQDSVGDLENDQGARLAKNRGFALQSFATTTDLDLEHTLSVRIDWFADCGYWSSLLSILHQGSRPFTMHDDVTDPIARKVARQLGSAGDAIAPPGTARRGALVLAGRGLKALPRLSSRRYVAHKIKTTLIRARGSLFLILRPYQIISGRLVRALRPRQRSLSGSPVFPIHDRVDVSIIVPVSNHWSHTLACLESNIGMRARAAA